jgi:hypothetical protein
MKLAGTPLACIEVCAAGVINWMKILGAMLFHLEWRQQDGGFVAVQEGVRLF